MMRAIHSHYRRLDGARRAETPLAPEEVVIRAVVPIADLGVRPARRWPTRGRSPPTTSTWWRSTSPTTPAEADTLRDEWEAWECGVELVIIESPFRSLTGPLLAYIDALQGASTRTTRSRWCCPEFVPVALVGAPAPQPDRAAPQGGAAVPSWHRRRQRAVSPGAASGSMSISARESTQRSTSGIRAMAKLGRSLRWPATSGSAPRSSCLGTARRGRVGADGGGCVRPDRDRRDVADGVCVRFSP